MFMEKAQLLFSLLTAFAAAYLIFFKSYFTEKGKNLATSQDIEKITSKVESVKSEFVKEIEQLKLEVQFSNQIKFSIKSEQIKSLLLCHETYFTWYHEMVGFSFALYSDENEKDLLTAQNKIIDAFVKFENAKRKFEMLGGNHDLYQEILKLQQITFDLHALLLLKIGDFLLIFVEMAYGRKLEEDDSLERFEKASQSRVELGSKYLEEMSVYRNQLIAMFPDFQVKMLETLHSLIDK
jgi:hypothetical protein